MSSTSGISFTGLGSGVDTASIVDQLIAISRQPITQVQIRQQREQTRQQALNDVSSRIGTLRSNADALTDPTFWNGAPNGVSGDTDSYSITATSSSPKASYQVQVLNLAASDVHVQTSTAGIRQFGTAYAASGVFASKTTLLTSLTTATGTPVGLAAGQTITLSGMKGGSPVTAALQIDATTTLDGLRSFVETSIPGSTVKVDTGGRLTITSPPGTDQEVTGLSLSTGGAAPLFDTAFSSSTATVAASGIGAIQANDVLHLSVGTLSFDVNVTAGMTMQQVATAINGANGGISAAVAGGRLRLAGSQTGAAQTVTFGSDGATAAQLGMNNVVHAADAQVTVDGVTYTSATNDSTDIIPGATLSLKRSSDKVTTATTDPTYVDMAEASRRVKAMIDQYNSVVDLIQTKVSEASVPNATTTTDQMKGVLFASSTLQSIRSSLQNAFLSPIAGLPVGANLGSQVGISTGPIGTGVNDDILAGKLQFDQTAFESLFQSDFAKARAMFDADGATAGSDGLARRISDLTKGFTSTGGLLQAAIDGSGEQIKAFQDQIDRMNQRVDDEEARLKTQFTAMETAISQLKSAQSAASSQFAQLSSSNDS